MFWESGIGHQLLCTLWGGPLPPRESRTQKLGPQGEEGHPQDGAGQDLPEEAGPQLPWAFQIPWLVPPGVYSLLAPAFSDILKPAMYL